MSGGWRTVIVREGGELRLRNSVYVKLLRNISSLGSELKKIRHEAPRHGSLWALPMNISTFQKLEIITGERFDMALFADDVVIIGDEAMK